MEAQEDPRKEGRLGEDPLARPDKTREEGDSQPREREDVGSSEDEFVKDMESDPSRAGSDSPAQNLQGG